MKKNGSVQRVTRRTTAGLCDALFEEFDALRNGKSDAHRAAAFAKLSVQIIGIKRLEMDAAMLLKGSGKIRPLMLENRGIPLGSIA